MTVRLKRAIPLQQESKQAILQPKLSPARIEAIHTRNCWSPSIKLPPVVNGFVQSQAREIDVEIPDQDLPQKMRRQQTYFKSPIKMEQIKPTPVQGYFYSKITVGPGNDEDLKQTKQMTRIQSGFSPSRLVAVLKDLKVLPEEKVEQKPVRYQKMQKFFEFSSHFNPLLPEIINLFPYSYQDNRPLSSITASISRQYARQACYVLTLKAGLPVRVSIVSQKAVHVELQKSKLFNKAVQKMEEAERKNAIAAKDILEISCGFRQSLKANYCQKLVNTCMAAIKQDEEVTKGSDDDINIRSVIMLIDQGIVGAIQKHVDQLQLVNCAQTNQQEFAHLIQTVAAMSLLGPQLREIMMQTKIYEKIAIKLADVFTTQKFGRNKPYFLNPDFFFAVSVLARLSTDFSLQIVSNLNKCLKMQVSRLKNDKTEEKYEKLRKVYRDTILDDDDEESEFEADYVDSKMRGLLLKSIAKQSEYAEQDGIRIMIAEKQQKQLIHSSEITQQTKYSEYDGSIMCCFTINQVLFGCLQQVYYQQLMKQNTDKIIDILQDEIKETYQQMIMLAQIIKNKRDGYKISLCNEFSQFGQHILFKLSQKSGDQLGEDLLAIEGWDEKTIEKMAEKIRNLFEE